jgi:hypothetical protein
MELIQTTTLGADAVSIEFTSIPQTFTDLVIMASLRSSNDEFASLRFNASTTNFTNRQVNGNGSSASSLSRTDTFVGYVPGPSQTANTFASYNIYVPNYSGSTHKSFSIDFVTENNATQAFQGIVAGLWSDTAAITSIQLFILASNGDYKTGSTVSLYGITKGSDGIVTTS